MDSSSAVVLVLVSGLSGKANVNVMKQILQGLTGNELWKTHLEMVIAIMENRPIEVVRLGGSREFRDGTDKAIGGILVNCAVEMLMVKAGTACVVQKK